MTSGGLRKHKIRNLSNIYLFVIIYFTVPKFSNCYLYNFLRRISKKHLWKFSPVIFVKSVHVLNYQIVRTVRRRGVWVYTIARLDDDLNFIFFYLLFFSFTLFFFCDSLTSSRIPFRFMSCNLSIVFEHPIICQTVKYINQSDNSYGRVLSYDTKG